jgi:hypothetical protein
MRQEARRQGVEWKQAEGARHDTFWLGSAKIRDPASRRDRAADDRGHPARVRSRAGERLAAERKTYQADVDRDGKVWRVRVPADAPTTQARTLREADSMARDLVAIMDDIPADSFDLDMTIVLPAEVRAELDRSAELREQAARSQAQAAQLARRAARRLRDQGLPYTPGPSPDRDQPIAGNLIEKGFPASLSCRGCLPVTGQRTTFSQRR